MAPLRDKCAPGIHESVYLPIATGKWVFDVVERFIEDTIESEQYSCATCRIGRLGLVLARELLDCC